MSTELLVLILMVIFLSIREVFKWKNRKKRDRRVRMERRLRKEIKIETITCPPEEGCVDSSNNMGGRYLVNFKEVLKIDGRIEDNDMMPATVFPYKGRLYICWDNGWTAVISHEYCNFKEIPK